jgi:cbb3-type cytochrome oxidase maturation protein
MLPYPGDKRMTKIIFLHKEQHFITALINAILYHQFSIMIITIFLLSVSLIVALIFLGAYLWSVKHGQFDDDYAPAHRIFFDDKVKPHKTKK